MKKVLTALISMTAIFLVAVIPVSAEYTAPVEGTVSPTVFDVTLTPFVIDFGSSCKKTLLEADLPTVKNNGSIPLKVKSANFVMNSGYVAAAHEADVLAYKTASGGDVPVWLTGVNQAQLPGNLFSDTMLNAVAPTTFSGDTLYAGATVCLISNGTKELVATIPPNLVATTSTIEMANLSLVIEVA